MDVFTKSRRYMRLSREEQGVQRVVRVLGRACAQSREQGQGQTSRTPVSRAQQGAEEESLEKESEQGDRRGGRWQLPQEPQDRLWAVSDAAEMSTETGIWKCWRGAGN